MDKKDLPFTCGYAAVGLLMFMIGELVIHVQENYVNFYICVIVALAVLVALRVAHVVLQIINYRKNAKKVDETQAQSELNS